MGLSDRTKSILLQVAFKSASQVAPSEKVEEITGDFYNILIGLHDKLGLSPDDSAPARRASAPVRRAANVEKAMAAADAPIIVLEGVEYLDYRGIKEVGVPSGDVNPNFPDFKLASNKQKSFWLLKNGEPTEFAIANGLV